MQAPCTIMLGFASVCLSWLGLSFITIRFWIKFWTFAGLGAVWTVGSWGGQLLPGHAQARPVALVPRPPASDGPGSSCPPQLRTSRTKPSEINVLCFGTALGGCGTLIPDLYVQDERYTAGAGRALAVPHLLAQRLWKSRKSPHGWVHGVSGSKVPYTAGAHTELQRYELLIPKILTHLVDKARPTVHK